MSPYALAALVTATLLALALVAILCARILDEVLHAPQRALVVGVSYAAGFVTAVVFFALRT